MRHYSSGLNLSPSNQKLHDIQTDYQEMGLMIFGENPPYEAVSNTIKEIELVLNNEILSTMEVKKSNMKNTYT
ncbi:MAG: hypothetical protein WCP46_01590 [Alphaproteobacteria bacterium]